MPSDAVVTIILLIVTVLAMATQRLRTDIIALLVLLFLIISGILTADEAFSVFGQPVILIVASIFVIGAALLDTGVATLIANQILRIGQGGEAYLMFIVMLTTAILTAFLDGLLVVALLLLPAVLRCVARQANLSPSRLLLPLATVATIGNTLTLIGTTSNPLVSDILAESTGAGLGLLTMTPFALASVGVVMAWYLTGGRLFLSRELPPEPHRLSLTEVGQSYQIDKLLYRLRVRSSSDLIAETVGANGGLQKNFGLNVIAIRPQGGPLQAVSPDQVLEQDDILIVEGDTGRILRAAQAHGLELKGTVSLEEFNQIELETLRLAELMIPFRSSLVGQSLTEIGFRRRFGLNVLAVHRQDQSIRTDLPQFVLAAGDTLLVQGTPASLQAVGRDLDLVRVTDLGPQPGDQITAKARWTMIILAAMLLLVMTGLASLATASVMAALALVMLKCLSPERAYQSINGSLLVLIGGMLSLSIALQKQGGRTDRRLHCRPESGSRCGGVAGAGLFADQFERPGYRRGGRRGHLRPHRHQPGRHSGRAAGTLCHRHRLRGDGRLHYPFNRRR
ncbi:MAG: SLC13 family permease [Anaerolineales bacterium]|nr:SLC13 family permease [Anaerolineales bacterium]